MQTVIAKTKSGDLIQGTVVARERGLVQLTDASLSGIYKFPCDVLIEERHIIEWGGLQGESLNT